MAEMFPNLMTLQTYRSKKLNKLQVEETQGKVGPSHILNRLLRLSPCILLPPMGKRRHGHRTKKRETPRGSGKRRADAGDSVRETQKREGNGDGVSVVADHRRAGCHRGGSAAPSSQRPNLIPGSSYFLLLLLRSIQHWRHLRT